MFALRQANSQAILQFVFPIPRQLLLVVYNHACGGWSSGNVLLLQKTCGWEATSLPVSFQCEISGYPLPKEPRLHGARCLEGAPQGSPACLLLTDQNERRPPGPWACNSCDNPKAGPLAHGSQHEAVGQGWALRTSSPMPLDGLDEFTQHRGGSKCVVCGGLLQIPDFPNPAPALF